MTDIIIGMHELIDTWLRSCNFAKYSLSLIIKREGVNYLIGVIAKYLYIYIYIMYCRYMEYLMKLIFISSNSRCDPFPKILIFKMYLFFYLFLHPREIFIEFISSSTSNKIKFKMATSNLDITHTFLSPLYCCIVRKLTNRFLLFAKFKRKERRRRNKEICIPIITSFHVNRRIRDTFF